MADTPNAGAPVRRNAKAAPILAAANVSPNAGAPLAPIELLQALAGWLDASGFDAARPWQVAIAATLASVDAAPLQSPATAAAADAADLFNEIAEAAGGLQDLLLAVMNGNSALMNPSIDAASYVGWLADAASLAHGGEACRGDAVAWFVSPRGAGALQRARLVAQAEGGVA